MCSRRRECRYISKMAANVKVIVKVTIKAKVTVLLVVEHDVAVLAVTYASDVYRNSRRHSYSRSQLFHTVKTFPHGLPFHLPPLSDQIGLESVTSGHDEGPGQTHVVVIFDDDNASFLLQHSCQVALHRFLSFVRNPWLLHVSSSWACVRLPV